MRAELEAPTPQTVEYLPVFVYGTLKPTAQRSNHNFTLIEHAITGQQPGSISGYDMFSTGMFPYVVPGDGTIQGEIITLDERRYAGVMRALDVLEGHPHHYVRMEVPIETATGETVRCWMYVAAADHDHIRQRYRHILSGVW